MAVDPQLPQVGTIVAGKYRVERVLGVGGMGAVFAVHHLGLDERRALKLMLPKGLELPQARERFFREARAAAKLRSDHAVKIHDVAVSPEGFPYIEMELLEGSDLAAIIRRSGPIPFAHAARWVAEACEPLGEAHALGIVHRDLKPGNLFLTRRRDGSDCVKVLDFGIAKTQQQLDVDPTLTSTNASFGSPMYMSPEQMRGARFAEPRSDLWALGVVLYELVTGRRPFQAESATALALVVTNDEPTPPSALRSDLPPALEAVILRCLAKRADARFTTAEELASALRAALGEVQPRAPLASTPQGFLGAPPSPFPLPGVASVPSLGGAPVAGAPLVGAPLGGAPVAGAPVAGAPVAGAPVAGAPVGGAATVPVLAGVPSQPTVATLTTTVGRRGGSGGALVIGGAITAAVIAGALLFVLLRSPGDAAPSGASAPPSSGPVEPSADVDASAVPGTRPPVAAAAPAPMETAPPAATSPEPDAATTTSASAPSPPVVASAPPKVRAPAPGSAPPTSSTTASPPKKTRPKSSTGFGGID